MNKLRKFEKYFPLNKKFNKKPSDLVICIVIYVGIALAGWFLVKPLWDKVVGAFNTVVMTVPMIVITLVAILIGIAALVACALIGTMLLVLLTFTVILAPVGVIAFFLLTFVGIFLFFGIAAAPLAIFVILANVISLLPAILITIYSVWGTVMAIIDRPKGGNDAIIEAEATEAVEEAAEAE